MDSRSEIVRQIGTYDENGLLKTVMYYRDSLGTPACDANGIYGRSYQYDEQDRTIVVSNLNKQGEVHDCKYGWATINYVYNAKGWLQHESFYNAAGNPVLNQNGCSKEVQEALGHYSSAFTLDTYAHVSEDALKLSAERKDAAIKALQG